MDTARVDICYRPVRVGWAISEGDFDAFRRAVRLSHCLWGGRYNPIIIVESPVADDLVELFGVDEIVDVSATKSSKAFRDRFGHLKRSIFGGRVFSGEKNDTPRLLDVHNAFVHNREKSSWKDLCARGIRTFSWEANDPLADIFLMRFGAYPSIEEIGIDYLGFLQAAAQPQPVIDIKIEPQKPIPIDAVRHPTISSFSRGNLKQHHSSRDGGWDFPGFFVGDPKDLSDLVNFWNLTASDITLSFIDTKNLHRFALTRPEYEANVRRLVRRNDEFRNKIGVWSKPDELANASKLLFPNGNVITCSVNDETWKYAAVRPPKMFIAQDSALGVLGNTKFEEKPRISFALKDKPFSSDPWFFRQNLVASLAVFGSYDDTHTFQPPHIPELNETIGRTMCRMVDDLRLESNRIGVVIRTNTHDLSVQAISIESLAEEFFKFCGFKVRPSSAGLVTRQLISRLGGVDGARPFKIVGVRRLIKAYGPRQSFTKKNALQLIGSSDPDKHGADFKAHKDLYIEKRPTNTQLTPDATFAYLVEKGLFRIGAELTCSSCRLPSWLPLDELRQQNTCDLCGTRFDATRQLVHGVFHYRRSGILGLEKNTLGAVPVALLLQQLSVNCQDGFLLPSLELTSKDDPNWSCETDFFGMYEPSPGQTQTRVVIGECKDAGGEIDQADVDNLRRLSDRLASKGFTPFTLFAKLGSFSAEEIALIKTLQPEFQRRVIILTCEELEPYLISDGKKAGGRVVTDIDDLADLTHDNYFSPNA